MDTSSFIPNADKDAQEILTINEKNPAPRG